MKWKSFTKRLSITSRGRSTSDSALQSPTIPETIATPSPPLSPCTESDSGEDNVQVCVRIRPLVKDERSKNERLAWVWENNTITQDASTIPKRNSVSLRQTSETLSPPMSYAFDHLFYPEHTNDMIFNCIVKKTVDKAMQGYHCSVFSYGQTSSGKTFTMNGTAKQPGLIPQAIYDCFECISEYRDREFLFRVSYLEIYNETVHDLLNPESSTQIKIQQDPKLGIVLSGVKEQVVMNPAQVIALLQGGEAHRHVGTTDMNDKSSRAHTLFKLIIESKALSATAGDPVRVSTLNLVDLAGSENAKMTNSKGVRAREAKHINQSLLTLSTIIHRLGEEEGGSRKKQHLPYRDSKLTRIMQTALSGNALITIICTISPTIRCVEETSNTLKFATRAKRIKMEAGVNETMDDKTLLRAYRVEIEQLKAKLADMESMMQTTKKKGADDDEPEDNQQLMLEMIDHMERLILKGEAQAKQEAEAKAARDKRPSGISRLKGPSRRTSSPRNSNSPRQATKKTGSKVIATPSAQNRSPSHTAVKKSSNDGSPPVKQSKSASDLTDIDVQVASANTDTMNSKKGIGETTHDGSDSGSEDQHNDTNESESGGDDDFFADISKRKSITPKQSMSPKAMYARRSIGPPAGNSRLSSSRVEDILAGVPREKLVSSTERVVAKPADPVLEGVSQMLHILKQHVTKPSKSKLSGGGSSGSVTTSNSADVTAIVSSSSTIQSQNQSNGISALSTVAQLQAELKRRESDNKQLQSEVDRLQENVDRKDNMLSTLTEGLKEVEVNQANLLAANSSLSEELDGLQGMYHEVVQENEVLKDEVRRLMACLQAREEQFYEITGRTMEEEEF
mmetsp:Transcript_3712/g.5745  ORF Transcript_3712/g.5745 Transcript_3712/m.5745 type:complete len:849 (-) Transcript_3712:32-2578(-)|eukprot:CAMPEP_0185039050 /NCGR_PEP_ID=MMETSP1103-20130426/35492_1 /TAXON_ID=36769 /ORGANISM="Paraphysomonas bandaiensis, Strain Caron Lab Isolate" /LENGTH=848 /DNA_ID=CAMNT_0027577797 /DNA_START=119 /DNA_END=2665 /DNA_ORIENTATION=-